MRGRALAGDLDLIAFYFGVSALGALGAFVERIVRARSEISDALTPTLAAFWIGIAMRALWRAHTDARVTPSSEKTVAMPEDHVRTPQLLIEGSTRHRQTL